MVVVMQLTRAHYGISYSSETEEEIRILSIHADSNEAYDHVFDGMEDFCWESDEHTDMCWCAEASDDFGRDVTIYRAIMEPGESFEFISGHTE